jgi:hypothetical protein
MEVIVFNQPRFKSSFHPNTEPRRSASLYRAHGDAEYLRMPNRKRLCGSPSKSYCKKSARCLAWLLPRSNGLNASAVDVFFALLAITAVYGFVLLLKYL